MKLVYQSINQQGIFINNQMVEHSSQHPICKSLFAQYRLLGPVLIVHQLQSYIVLNSNWDDYFLCWLYNLERYTSGELWYLFVLQVYSTNLLLLFLVTLELCASLKMSEWRPSLTAFGSILNIESHACRIKARLTLKYMPLHNCD